MRVAVGPVNPRPLGPSPAAIRSGWPSVFEDWAPAGPRYKHETPANAAQLDDRLKMLTGQVLRGSMDVVEIHRTTRGHHITELGQCWCMPLRLDLRDLLSQSAVDLYKRMRPN